MTPDILHAFLTTLSVQITETADAAEKTAPAARTLLAKVQALGDTGAAARFPFDRVTELEFRLRGAADTHSAILREVIRLKKLRRPLERRFFAVVSPWSNVHELETSRANEICNLERMIEISNAEVERAIRTMRAVHSADADTEISFQMFIAR